MKALKRIVSALILVCLLVTLIPLAPSSVLAAVSQEEQTDSGSIGKASDASLDALGFDTGDKGQADEMIEDGVGPFGDKPVAIETISELMFSKSQRNQHDSSYSDSYTDILDFGKTEVKDININQAQYNIGGGGHNNVDSIRSSSFDPEGAGKENYVAQVCATVDVSTERTRLELRVVDARNGSVSNRLYLCTLPFKLISIQAGAYLAITTGDYDGDGKDEIAVYVPSRIMSGTDSYPDVMLYSYNVTSKGFTQLDRWYSIVADISDPNKMQFNGINESSAGKNENYALDYPIVSLCTVEQPDSEMDDIVIAVSYARNAKDRPRNPKFEARQRDLCSRVAVWVDQMGANKKQDFKMQWYWKDDYGSTGGLTGADQRYREVMLFAGVGAGDIDGNNPIGAIGGEYNGDGYNEVVVAGYRVEDPNSQSNSWILSKDEFLATYLTYSPKNNSYAVAQPGMWISMGKSDYNNNTDIRDGFNNNNNILDNVLPPMVVTCFKERGNGYAESVFVNGFVLALKSTTMTGYLVGGVNRWPSYAGYPSIYRQDLENVEAINKIANPFCTRYAVPLVRMTEVLDRFDNRFVTEAVAAQFSGGSAADGREQIVFGYMARSTSILYRQFAGAIGFFGYYGEQEAANPLQPGFYTYGQRKISQGYYDYSTLSIAAPDNDDDSLIMRPHSLSKKPEFYFSDPQVIAVLQAAPYFEDLGNVGSTSLTKSQGSGSGMIQGINASLGAWFAWDVEAGVVFKAASWSGKIGGKFSAGYEYEFSYEEEFSTTYTSADDDSVALVMSPYVRYYYELWDPDAKKWCEVGIDVPSGIQVTQITVDDYDRVAGLNGWDTIRGNLLFNTPGDPMTYIGASGPGKQNGTWWGGRTIGGGGTDNYITLGKDGGSIAQSMSASDTYTHTITSGGTFFTEMEFIGAAVGGGFSVEVEYTGGFFLTSFYGTSYEGSVTGIAPQYGSDYSFDWNFGQWTGKLKTSGSEADCIVLCYDVRNVRSLPRIPKPAVKQVAQDAVTLAWAHSGARYYEVSRYENGMYYRLGTVDYQEIDENGELTFTDINCKPSSSYTYAVRGFSYSGNQLRSSDYSQLISAHTQPDGNVPIIVSQSGDREIAAGSGTVLSVTVNGAVGSGYPITYRWERYTPGSGWTTVTGGNSYMLNLYNVMESALFRCVVSQMVDGSVKSVYSKNISVEIGLNSTETAVSFVDGITKGEGPIVVQNPPLIDLVETNLMAEYDDNDEDTDDIYSVFAIIDDPEEGTYLEGTYYLLKGGVYYLVENALDIQTIQAASKNQTTLDAIIKLTAQPTEIVSKSPLVYLDGGADSGVTNAIFAGEPVEGSDELEFPLIYTTAAYETKIYNESTVVRLTPYQYETGDGTVNYHLYYLKEGDDYTQLVIKEGQDYFLTLDGNATAIPINIFPESITPDEEADPITVDAVYITGDYLEYTDESDTVYAVSIFGETRYYMMNGESTLVELKLGAPLFYVRDSELTGFEPARLTQVRTIIVVDIDTGSHLEPGDPIVVTASVTSNSSLIPTGNVVFTFTNTGTGTADKVTVSLVNGVATCTWFPPATGYYTVSATYQGSATHQASSQISQTQYYAYKYGSQFSIVADTSSIEYGDTLGLIPTLYTTDIGGDTDSERVNAAYSVTFNEAGKEPQVIDGLISGNNFTPDRVGSFTITAVYDDGTKEYIASRAVTVSRKQLSFKAGSFECNLPDVNENFVNQVLADVIDGLDYHIVPAEEDKAKIKSLLYAGIGGSTDVGGIVSMLQGVGEYTVNVDISDAENLKTVREEIDAKYYLSFEPGILEVLADMQKVSFTAGPNGNVYASIDGMQLTSGNRVINMGMVTFNALPDIGYEVQDWTVNGVPQGSTEPELTATANEDMDVEVSFQSRTYLLTYTAGANGSLSAVYTGTEYPFVSGNRVFSSNDITFAAAPDDGYMVSKWTVDGVEVKNTDGSLYAASTYNKNGFTKDTVVHVEFVPATSYTVQVSAINMYGDPIDPAYAAVTIDIPVGEDGKVDAGSSFTITAAAKNPAYQINEWRQYHENGSFTRLQGNVLTYKISNLQRDLDIRVVFQTSMEYIVNFGVSGGSGTLTAKSGSQAFASGAGRQAGSTVTFTAVPDIDYEVDKWTVNGTEVPGETGETYTLSNLAEDVTVTVSFRQIPKIIFAQPAGGTVAALMDGTAVTSGDDLTTGLIQFTLTPDNGYELDTLSLQIADGPLQDVTGQAVYVDGSGSTTDAKQYTLEVDSLDGDITLTAAFKEIEPQITLTYGVDSSGAAGTLSASVDRKGARQQGDAAEEDGSEQSISGIYRDAVITLTAQLAASCVIESWTVNGRDLHSTLNEQTITVDASAEDLHVVVKFKELSEGAVEFAVEGGTGGGISAELFIDGEPQGPFVSGDTPGEDATIVFTAEPNDGYEVEAWYCDGVLIDGETGLTYEFTPTPGVGATITVKFIRVVYHTVHFSGTNGTVTAICDGRPLYSGEDVRDGKTVTFTAVVDSGYAFSGWLVNGVPRAETDSTLTLTIQDDTNTVAEFIYLQPTVHSVQVMPSDVTVIKGGTEIFSATVIGENNPSQEVTWTVEGGNGTTGITSGGRLTVAADETAATLTVRATSVADTTKSGTAKVTVDLSSVFVAVTQITHVPDTATVGTPLQLTGTVVPSDATNKTIIWSVSPNNTLSGVNVSGTVFTATTAGTAKIRAVITNGTTTGDYIQDFNITVDAGAPVQHTITASAGTGGSISPSGSVTVDDGGDQTFTITANNGYQILDVLVDGTSVGAVGLYTFNDVRGDHTIHATFNSSSSGGGTSTTKPSIPAADGMVKVNYSQNRGETTLTLPGSKVTEIIGKSEDTVTFDLRDVKDTTKVTLPKAALDDFAEAGLDVAIMMPEGTVMLSGEAAASVSGQAGGNTVSVELKQVPVSSLTTAQREAVKTGDRIIDINMLSGTQKISEFDGELTVTVPYDGGLPAAVWYLNDDGELEKLDCTYNAEAGTVSFKLDHLSLYVVGRDTDASVWVNPFSDVFQSDWFYAGVEYAVTNGLFSGTSATTFSPNTTMTRGMMVTVLWRMAGSPGTADAGFSDVSADAWYAAAVNWAAANGIVNGVGDNRFAPDDNITREQMAVILHNFAKTVDMELPQKREGDFADHADISPWAKEAVDAMYAAEVLNGKGGNNFDPKGNATRAEVATMFMNFLEAAE